jgi:phospholipid/cholesterol/gamma-HCH transport system substrate-binding protein
MKKTVGNKVRLGIFVSISITLFIVAIYFIGQRQQLFISTFHLSGIFKDISGLQVGNNVRFSGISVGIIDGIEQISDSTVRVDMQVDESTRKFIKTNARAIIGSDGLMGNKIIVILPGTAGNPEVIDNDTLATTQPVSLDDIMLSLAVTAENAALITADLAIVMENVRAGKGTIGKLLMDSILAKNVGDAMFNIKQGAGGFKENMDAAGHNILLRGYIKKKDRKEEAKKEEARKKAEEKKANK